MADAPMTWREAFFGPRGYREPWAWLLLGAWGAAIVFVVAWVKGGISAQPLAPPLLTVGPLNFVRRHGYVAPHGVEQWPRWVRVLAGVAVALACAFILGGLFSNLSWVDAGGMVGSLLLLVVLSIDPVVAVDRAHEGTTNCRPSPAWDQAEGSSSRS